MMKKLTLISMLCISPPLLISQSGEKCKMETLETVFVRKSVTQKASTIVLALNNTKKNQPELLTTALDQGDIASIAYISATFGKEVFTLSADLVHNKTDGRLEYTFTLPVDDGKTPWEWTSSTQIFKTKCGTRVTYFAENKKNQQLSGNWNAYDATPQEKSDGPDNFGVSSLNINPSSFSVTSGIITFKEKSEIEFSADITFSKQAPAVVVINMNGSDKKGNKATRTIKALYNRKTGNYEAAMKEEEGFVLNEASVEVQNMFEKAVSFTGVTGKPSRNSEFSLLLFGKTRPRYGQCMVFSKSDKKDEGGSFVQLGGLEVVVSRDYQAEKKSSLLQVDIEFGKLNNGRESDMDALLLWGDASTLALIGLEDRNGKTSVVEAKPFFDASSGKMRLTYKNSSWTGGNWSGTGISYITLQVNNTCGDTFSLKTAYRSGGDSSSGNTASWNEEWAIVQGIGDGCSNHMQIEDATASAARSGGVYAVKFALTPGKRFDAAGSVVINMKMSNCKGEIIYVDVTLKYSKTSGSFIGSQSFIEEKGCEWKCEDLTLKTLNSCGEVVKKGGYPGLIQKMKDKIAKGDV